MSAGLSRRARPGVAALTVSPDRVSRIAPARSFTWSLGPGRRRPGVPTPPLWCAIIKTKELPIEGPARLGTRDWSVPRVKPCRASGRNIRDPSRPSALRRWLWKAPRRSSDGYDAHLTLLRREDVVGQRTDRLIISCPIGVTGHAHGLRMMCAHIPQNGIG